MEPDQAIQKATLLLDLKGDVEGALRTLRESLKSQRNVTPEGLRTQILLGELLLKDGQAEGAAELLGALSAALPEEWDDLVDADLARARGALQGAILEAFNLLLQSPPNKDPHELASTGWLDSPSPERLEELYAQYTSLHQVARATLEGVVGAPSRALPTDAEWFGEWYPEAFAASAWQRGGRYVCLATEHHDHEAPVVLSLFAVAADDTHQEMV